MGGLIVLVILIPVVIIILLASVYSKTSVLQDSVDDLQKQLGDLAKQLQQGNASIKDKKANETVPVIPLQKEIVREQKPVPPIIIPPPVKEIKEEPAQEVQSTNPVQIQGAETIEESDERSFREKEKWFEKNKDLEKFIGENLINKIGIAILVLGIAFFVKYAIDKDWIRESGRVLIGLASGGILIGIAHYIRNSYRSFSSVLVGGGLTVFYFTIAFAFHEYHLLSQQLAFIIMVIISAFAVLLSLYYNRQELAILATIGGFITPFLVTTGQENYIALFTYLCILNTGLMVLAWFKRWTSINMIALFFTTLIYGGWLIRRFLFSYDDDFPYKDAFLFASLFYVLSVLMNIINSLRMKRPFQSFDFIVILSINFLYYAGGMAILSQHSGYDYKGLFTVSLGIVNLLLVAVFYKQKNIDRNFVSLLIALSLLFISLAAPVQFRGNHIVLFWAAESVVLFWLYQRTRSIHLKIASLIICVLTLLSLLISWMKGYLTDNGTIPVITNKWFITTLAASLAFFIYYALVKKEKDPDYVTGLSNNNFKNFLLTTAVIIIYLGGVLEINYQFRHRFPETDVYTVYLQAYTFAFAIIVLQVFRKSGYSWLLRLVLTILCLGFYVLNAGFNKRVSIELLERKQGLLFAAHWLAAIFLLWLLYDMIRFYFSQKKEDKVAYRDTFSWLAAISIVWVLSMEMYHVIVWTHYTNQEDWIWWLNLYNKAGLTILWSLCSFILMWMGMRYSFRTLRIISLTLFTITLVKLFGYDIRDIPPGGKIAAFILLGVLLLTVSFMYQRLKKIIIENKGE